MHVMQIFVGVASFAVRALHLHDHRNCFFKILQQGYAVRALGVQGKRGSITGSVLLEEETSVTVEALQILKNWRTKRAVFGKWGTSCVFFSKKIILIFAAVIFVYIHFPSVFSFVKTMRVCCCLTLS